MTCESTLGLPALPDDDKDFTPELARKIIAKYQRLLEGCVEERNEAIARLPTYVAESEIEAASMALKALWESPENVKALAETGYGVSWRAQAIAALTAAMQVAGRTVVYHETTQ